MAVNENIINSSNNINFTVQCIKEKTPSLSPQSQSQITTNNKYDVLTCNNLDEMRITSDTFSLHKVKQTKDIFQNEQAKGSQRRK